MFHFNFSNIKTFDDKYYQKRLFQKYDITCFCLQKIDSYNQITHLRQYSYFWARALNDALFKESNKSCRPCTEKRKTSTRNTSLSLTRTHRCTTFSQTQNFAHLRGFTASGQEPLPNGLTCVFKKETSFSLVFTQATSNFYQLIKHTMLDLQIRTCTGRLSTGSPTLLSVLEKNCVSFQKTKMHNPRPAA